MSEAPEPGDARPPRPNPFAFPSDTTFRFGLLVAAVLGATLYVWNWIWIVAGVDQTELSTAAIACLRSSQEDLLAAGGDPAAIARATDAFSACVERAYADAAVWMVGGVLLVVAVAAALVLLWPRLKERRAGFRPLEAEDAPDVLATLGELAREAELPREPRWVWNPLARGATGLAFGHPGRYSVGLTGGLVIAHTTDPDAFRAVVRHELAHIRNRDVGATYATLSLWYAFLAAAVVPFAFTLLEERDIALSVTWRLAALAALVYLTRNAVLRAREVYADVRASTVDGPDGALSRVVGALRPERSGPLGRLLALHPAPERRVAALRDTRPLLSIGPLAAFAAGIAATISFDSVQTLVASRVNDPLDVAMIAALVFAPLVVGVVGVALWRDRFGALAAQTPVQPVWPLGLALVAGFLVGPELALARAVTLPEQRDGLLVDLLQGESLLWIAALVVLVLLLLDWIAGSASVWLRAEAARSSRDARTAALLVAAGALTILLGAFYSLREFSQGIVFSRELSAEQHAQVSAVASAGPRWLWQLVMDSQTLVLLARPLVPAAIVSLWAVPLGVVLVRRRRRAGEAPWAFLDDGGRLEPEWPHVSLVRPLVVGAGAGIACLVAFAVHRGAVHGSVSLATRNTDEFVLSFFFWQIVIALVAQALAGGIATALARDRVRLAEGLCAATVTATIATFGIVAGPVAGGCFDPLSIRPGPCTWDVSGDFTWDVWRQVAAEGAVAAVGAGLLVLAVTAAARPRTPRSDRAELDLRRQE